MKPVDPNTIAALRISGLVMGALVAAATIYQYMLTGRPDASEVRDLWLIVALELAAMPIALSLLLPRAEVAAQLAPTPAAPLPNPWAY